MRGACRCRCRRWTSMSMSEIDIPTCPRSATRILYYIHIFHFCGRMRTRPADPKGPETDAERAELIARKRRESSLVPVQCGVRGGAGRFLSASCDEAGQENFLSHLPLYRYASLRCLLRPHSVRVFPMSDDWQTFWKCVYNKKFLLPKVRHLLGPPPPTSLCASG